MKLQAEAPALHGRHVVLHAENVDLKLYEGCKLIDRTLRIRQQLAAAGTKSLRLCIDGICFGSIMG